METNSDESSSSEAQGGADLAALIGATIAILFTVTNTPGAWGPLSTIIGLLLLIVLLAFFWTRRPPIDRRKIQSEQDGSRRSPLSRKWELALVGVALSVVVAYVAAMTSAQAVQDIWFSNNNASFECRSVAVEQAVAAVHDLSDSSSGAATLRQLIDDTLQNGHPSGTYTVYGPLEAQGLKIGFYDAYDDALGGCLADETLDSLWWVGVPLFLLTLVWWNWAYIRTRLLGGRLSPAIFVPPVRDHDTTSSEEEQEPVSGDIQTSIEGVRNEAYEREERGQG